jgi:hypothetical protein
MNFMQQIKIEVLGYFVGGGKMYFLIGQELPWQANVLLERVAYWKNYFHLNKTYFILEDLWQSLTTNVLKYWTSIFL